MSTSDKELKRNNRLRFREEHPNYDRKWYAAHREDILQRQNERSRAIKNRVILHYGGRCVQCENDDIRCLGLHHTNGGGLTHRRQLTGGVSAQIYRKIELEGYPKGLEVLCANCHMVLHCKY